uniref:Uncharacterized protein n=1 Tax=Romanomermis culicivorax TaxID=13658 RepID=A0A915HQW7_ROMCU
MTMLAVEVDWLIAGVSRVVAVTVADDGRAAFCRLSQTQSSVLWVRDLWALHQRPVGCGMRGRSRLADRSKRLMYIS